MIKAREGQVIDFDCCLVMAVKEIQRNACLGCFFNSVTTFYIDCSKLLTNCPSNKLIFKEINYNMTVKCIKELQTKHITFKVNEEYKAQKVNENWYCVDSVGIKIEDFDKHFQLEKGGL
jgi:hypothetical protein